MSNPTEPLEFPNRPEGPDVVKHPKPGSRPAKEGTVRVGTIVWGAVVVALGTLIILTRQAGLSLDAGQTAIWLLFGAGVAMVAGGAINLLRRNTP